MTADTAASALAATARNVMDPDPLHGARHDRRGPVYPHLAGVRRPTPNRDLYWVTGEVDLRLWVLRVDRWEVHISGAHPTLGSGTDRRTPVDPTE